MLTATSVAELVSVEVYIFLKYDVLNSSSEDLLTLIILFNCVILQMSQESCVNLFPV